MSACNYGALALLLSHATHAAVAEQFAGGFELRYEQLVPRRAEQIYLGFVRIGSWWDLSQTYTGKADGLTLKLGPGGCFCEHGKHFYVRHLELVFAEKYRRLVFTGGLGPLQSMAVNGVLSVTITPGAEASTLQWTYRVSGGDPAKMSALAKPVDSLMQGQFERFVRYLQPAGE